MPAETGRPGAVLFVDLNGFKSINDKYGHQIGDRRLPSAAQDAPAASRSPGGVVGRRRGLHSVRMHLFQPRLFQGTRHNDAGEMILIRGEVSQELECLRVPATAADAS